MPEDPNVEEDDVVEKEQKHARMYYVGDAISFEEVERLRGAHEAASEIAYLTEDFHEIINNVITDKTIDDKTGAINFVTNEFTRRVEDSFGKNVQQKEGGLIDKIVSLVTGEKGKQFKRENGLDFPATDYAFVPDASKPSTWKLRLTERPGEVSASQLGRAAAALSSGGFRGDTEAKLRELKKLPGFSRVPHAAWHFWGVPLCGPIVRRMTEVRDGERTQEIEIDRSKA